MQASRLPSSEMHDASNRSRVWKIDVGLKQVLEVEEGGDCFGVEGGEKPGNDPTSSIALRSIVMLIICMLIVTIIHSMQRNNFLLQTQKDNTSVFWRKKTNNRKLDLTRQSPHYNPVYRVLKNQRDSNTILAFILGQGETKSPSKHMRSQSYEVQRYRSNSKQLKEKETFRQKAVDIMFKATRMSQEMEGSRKRFKILNKFNKTVEKYYSNRTEGEEDDAALAQSIMANNDELMKMYNEQNYLSLSLKKRASSCIKYTQPRIPRDKIRKLKQKVRIILNVTPKSKNSTATKPLIATTNDP